MRGYSAEQVRAAERPLLAAGVPLMARAAAALAREVATLSAARGGGRIAVLAGPGDNGGDALYAAATLARGGADVVVIPVASRVHEAAWDAALEAGARHVSPDAAAGEVAGAGIVVDGMRGIGGSGAGLRGTPRDVAVAVRPLLDGDGGGGDAAPLVVAVDVPSGIDADDGSADDAVLPADVTVTFGLMKAGLLREPARTLAGRVILIDIGLDDIGMNDHRLEG